MFHLIILRHFVFAPLKAKAASGKRSVVEKDNQGKDYKKNNYIF
jgi:hypothetical protein